MCFSFVVYAAPDGVRKLKLKKKDVVASSKAKEDREVAALMLTCVCLPSAFAVASVSERKTGLLF